MSEFDVEDECDICHSPIEAGSKVDLSCQHNYCLDCALHYIKLGGPTRKLTFNHLFCPYRCGSSFRDCRNAMRNPELRSLVKEQHKLMDKVNDVAVSTLLKRDSDMDISTVSVEKLLETALNTFSFYSCDLCEEIFSEENTCCAASDADVPDGVFCADCKGSSRAARHRSPALTLWQHNQQVRRALFVASSASTAFEELQVCSSDYNAAEQSSELEILLSMYPDDVTVITPPPTAAGELCGIYVFKPPTTQDVVSVREASVARLLTRIMTQIRVLFKCTNGYPSFAPPMILLQIGDLSLYEFNSSMKSILSADLNKVISENAGTACAYSCFEVIIEWLGKLRNIVEVTAKKDQASLDLENKRKQILADRQGYRSLTDFLKKMNCRQCYRCGFGPYMHDVCPDLTEYHGMALTWSRYRVDNSCAQCGWFAVSWTLWPLWSGKYFFERDSLLAGNSDADLASKPQSELTPAEKTRLKKLEAQNLNCLVASLRAHAKQCGRCGYGPVLHQHCDMLNTHQGEQTASGSRINNSCPMCGWFAQTWSEWKPWSGKLMTNSEANKIRKQKESAAGGAIATAATADATADAVVDAIADATVDVVVDAAADATADATADVAADATADAAVDATSRHIEAIELSSLVLEHDEAKAAYSNSCIIGAPAAAEQPIDESNSVL